MKRTPLRRNTPLRTTSTLRRRAALRAVSDKRAAVLPERAALVLRMISRHPVCQVCGKEPSSEVHERLSRARGGSIIDETNAVAVGRECHRRIHDEPAWAAEQGLLIASWQTS